MNDTKTVVGVDIAKRVFQVHEVDVRTGELQSVQLKRAKFLEYFVNRTPCLIGYALFDRYGGLRWCPALGAAADHRGAHGEAVAGAAGAAVCWRQQK